MQRGPGLRSAPLVGHSSPLFYRHPAPTRSGSCPAPGRFSPRDHKAAASGLTVSGSRTHATRLNHPSIRGDESGSNLWLIANETLKTTGTIQSHLAPRAQPHAQPRAASELLAEMWIDFWQRRRVASDRSVIDRSGLWLPQSPVDTISSF